MAPWPTSALWLRGVLFGLAGTLTGIQGAALLTALKAYRETKVFAFGDALLATVLPGKPAEAIDLVGASLFGVLVGVAVAATMAARGKRGER